MADIEYEMELLAASSDPADRDKALQYFQKQNTKQNKRSDNKLISWRRKTAVEIMSTEYPPLKWAVEGIICEGLSKIDGEPKVGKSWLALHLATAVSHGGCFMGSIHVDKRQVLYLALEDNERRIKDRLIKQGGIANDNLIIETPESWKGGVIALRSYLKEYPETGLIIIDTLFRFTPLEDSNEYSKTYKPIAVIQEIATETRVPVVLIHHTRKGVNNNKGESWADEGMGSQGINAAIDTILLLQKKDGKNEGTLRIKGRDIEEKCFDVTFDRDLCTWRITGEGDIVKSDPKAQAELLSLLEKAGPEGMKPAEIQKALGKKSTAISNLEKAVLDKGKIEKLANGNYRHSQFHKNSEMNISENVNKKEFTNSQTPRESENVNNENEYEIY